MTPAARHSRQIRSALPVRTRAGSNLRLTAAIATGSVKLDRAAPHRTPVIGPTSSSLESGLLPG